MTTRAAAAASVVVTAAGAEVAKMKPLMMRTGPMASYTGFSKSWLEHCRNADTQAKAEGRATSGPPWIVLNGRVFYLTAEVDKWVAENAIERGALPFANRRKKSGG